jgi:4-hydroxybenzoate polyprenyltransferase/phosphoserine phosphatase
MQEPHEESAQNGQKSSVPLCVDLDHTLIRTDVLWESVVRLWSNPALALRAATALILRGKAQFKAMLAATISIDPATLPYRQDVLGFVRSQHAKGREVVLATATHRLVAQCIADHLQVFSRVFATDDTINLSGDRKSAALEAAFGKRGFDYCGDGRKDLPTFAAAREALLVDPSRSLLAEASAIANVSRVFRETRPQATVAARALRLHQWVKNVLLLVPLLAAHLIFDVRALISVMVAFVAFGLVASASYLCNDLLDLNFDRLHPQKRHRPLASGQLAIRTAVMLVAPLGLLGFVLSAAFLPPGFVAYLAAYVGLTLAYSADLKRRLLIDVLVLAGLYTLRILAGGAAVGVVVSEWLLMFSFFIFVSLAFLKRFIELRGSATAARLRGRGYASVDVETIRVGGVSSGLVSVLVLALYINSPMISVLYRSPGMLWFICPLMVYWILRMWFLAARGEVHHDPVVFALFDRWSYALGGCVFVVALIAKVGIGKVLF